MTAETLIMEALFEHLSTLVLDPVHKIAWPNRQFPGLNPDGSPKPKPPRYLRVQFVPNVTNRIVISSDGPHQHLGLLQVSVYDAKDKGENRGREIAGQIAAHFATDLRLFNDPISVRITKHPDVSDIIVEKEAIQIPVMVAWECYTRPIAATPPGYSFVNAEAAALAARFTVPADDARKAVIDNLVGSLKTAGVWSKLDALYLMAAADSQAARQNWIADQYNLTPISGPTFIADRGYTGDGAASHLATGFNPATAVSPKFVQDSAMLGFWSRTDTTAAAYFDIGNSGALLNSRSNNANQPRGGINGGSLANFGATADSLGLHAIQRSGASARQVYRGGSVLGSDTPASTAPANGEVLLLRSSGTNYSVRQGAMGAIGAALTGGEHAAFEAAIETYLQAVGAV